MALSGDDLNRIELIEDTINKLLVWLNNTVSKLQFRQLMNIRQTEIDSLTNRISQIEDDIAIIKNTLKNMSAD